VIAPPQKDELIKNNAIRGAIYQPEKAGNLTTSTTISMIVVIHSSPSSSIRKDDDCIRM